MPSKVAPVPLELLRCAGQTWAATTHFRVSPSDLDHIKWALLFYDRINIASGRLSFDPSVLHKLARFSQRDVDTFAPVLQTMASRLIAGHLSPSLDRMLHALAPDVHAFLVTIRTIAKHELIRDISFMAPAMTEYGFDINDDTLAHAFGLGVRPAGITVLPLRPEFTLSKDMETVRTDVLGFVLTRIPIPDRATPIEAVLDWRADENAKNKLAHLRAWIAKMSRDSLSVGVVANELEAMLGDYTTYMQIHHTLMRMGTVEMVVTAAVEFIEEAIHLRFSKALGKLFALRRRKTELAKAELSAPGREVAYLANVSAHFSRREPGAG